MAHPLLSPESWRNGGGRSKGVQQVGGGGSVLGRWCVLVVYIVVAKHSWRAADVFGSSLGEVYCSCFRKMVGGWQCWDQPSCSREGSVGGERS